MELQNDFIGSFAQENVQFQTQVVKTSQVGDNYWKLMIFIENDRFIKDGVSSWPKVPGHGSAKALTVTGDTYASIVSPGLLYDWLTDFYANGAIADCILVAIGAKPVKAEGPEDFAPLVTALQEVYPIMAPYAYHKTVCIGETLNVDTAVELAKLCGATKEAKMMSSAPYLPYSTATPETTSSDLLFTALKEHSADAFLSCHADVSRNAALYSLGLVLSYINSSVTSVGNSFDMVKSSMISPSGADGLPLPLPTKQVLDEAHIQYFKPVGDNSGSVAAIGAETINGENVQANWILAYITYMVKVEVARLLTTPNFMRNAGNYAKILGIMIRRINQFGPGGSGRLTNISITAPAFSKLPESSGDEYIIPNAWNAVYVDQVRSVKITGALYIGG